MNALMMLNHEYSLHFLKQLLSHFLISPVYSCFTWDPTVSYSRSVGWLFYFAISNFKKDKDVDSRHPSGALIIDHVHLFPKFLYHTLYMSFFPPHHLNSISISLFHIFPFPSYILSICLIVTVPSLFRINAQIISPPSLPTLPPPCLLMA